MLLRYLKKWRKLQEVDYNQMLQIFYVWFQVIDLRKNQMDENQINLVLVNPLSKKSYKFYWKLFSQIFFQNLVKEKSVGSY